MNDFFAVRDLISIVHHVPGRIRLKLDPDIRKLSAAAPLAALSENRASGLLGVRLNVLARSLVLEYDTHKIDPKLLTDFLTTRDRKQAEELAGAFAGLFGIDIQSEDGK